MPKTYGTVATFTAGSVLTAAQLNVAGTAINNLVVPPMVSVYRSSTLSAYTSGTAITWQASHYDTDGMWTSGSSIAINTTGLYSVSFIGHFTCTATATLVVPELKRSAVNILSQFQPIYNGTESRISLSGVVDCAAGDSLSLDVTIVGGSSYSIEGGATYGEAQARLALQWIGRKS